MVPWACDSNRLFLGLCYLLLCALTDRPTRCLDGFAWLLDKFYGSVGREQHWGSTQLIMWEYVLPLTAPQTGGLLGAGGPDSVDDIPTITRMLTRRRLCAQECVRWTMNTDD